MGIYIVQRGGGPEVHEKMQRKLNALTARIPDAVMEFLKSGETYLSFQFSSLTASDDELRRAYEALAD